MRAIPTLVLLAVFAATDATAQSAKQLIGTWRLVEIKGGDGKADPNRGARPSGLIYYDAHGNMAAQIMPDRPRAKYAVAQPTPEEAKAAITGYTAYFGTYTVDEEKKTVTYKIVSSSFPNWEGEAQTRVIDTLTDEEFGNTNPNVAGGRGSASNRYKRVK